MATFCRRLRQFNIKNIKKKASFVEVKDAVKKELNMPGERLGYRAMNRKLRMAHDIKVPRGLVYTVMQELDDEVYYAPTPLFTGGGGGVMGLNLLPNFQKGRGA